MKVYILNRVVAYEGSYIIDVFPSYEAAKVKALEEKEQSRKECLFLEEGDDWPDGEYCYYCEPCPVCTDMEGYVRCYNCRNTKLVDRIKVVREFVDTALTIKEWEVEE